MTDKFGRAYERGFQDGSSGREFAPPYVKPDNRDWYAHGYYSGEYTFQQQREAMRGYTFCNFRADEEESA